MDRSSGMSSCSTDFKSSATACSATARNFLRAASSRYSFMRDSASVPTTHATDAAPTVTGATGGNNTVTHAATATQPANAVPVTILARLITPLGVSQQPLTHASKFRSASKQIVLDVSSSCRCTSASSMANSNNFGFDVRSGSSNSTQAFKLGLCLNNIRRKGGWPGSRGACKTMESTRARCRGRKRCSFSRPKFDMWTFVCPSWLYNRLANFESSASNSRTTGTLLSAIALAAPS
mmetsp:Transcript_13331/g.47055  ORF Transcript_13331/g.47055 Transcript_13331/m.47055 type:complete len:236 (-) Transcript_13331:304-1011(-)